MHINDLVPGRRYNIKGTSNNSGVFVKYIDKRYADFNSLILDGIKERSSSTLCCYCIDRWTFHDSACTYISRQVARGLCDRIPEDTAGIIESFLIGKNIGSGPYRYPRR